MMFFYRCIIFLASKIANQEKIHYFFELFNFNNKGYLLESEITLMLLAITRGHPYRLFSLILSSGLSSIPLYSAGAYKVDQKYHPPSINAIAKLAKDALSNAIVVLYELSASSLSIVTVDTRIPRSSH